MPTRYAFAHVARQGATSGSALARHQDGDLRPETALPRAGIPAIVHFDERGEVTDDAGRERLAAEVERRLAQCRRVGSKTRGRKPAVYTDILCAGPPPYAAEDAWSQQRIHEWARASVCWALKRAGSGSRLVRAVLHQDETSPHLHIRILAADDRGRAGWNRIRHQFQTEAAPIKANARGKYASKTLMRELQSAYHQDVGSAFGLERGEDVEKTGRKRRPIDRDAGLAARVDEERAAAVDARDAQWRTVVSEGMAKERASWDKERRALVRARDSAFGRERATAAELGKLRTGAANLVERYKAVVSERDAAVQDRDGAIRERDAAVRGRDRAVLACDAAVGELETARSARDEALERAAGGEDRDRELRIARGQVRNLAAVVEYLGADATAAKRGEVLEIRPPAGRSGRPGVSAPATSPARRVSIGAEALPPAQPRPRNAGDPVPSRPRGR